jgi:hypothetical protein
MTNRCDEVQNRAIIFAPATAVFFHTSRQTNQNMYFLFIITEKNFCFAVLLCSLYDLNIHRT